MKNFIWILLTILFFTLGCNQDQAEQQTADLILINGNIATVNANQPRAKAIAIGGDRILYVGEEEEALAFQGEETEVRDLNGQFVMPGFIEGHGHFAMMGKLRATVNLMETKTWDEVVAAVEKAAQQAEPGVWIEGRGWHQEKWTETPEPNVLGYPFHDELSAVSPNNPVILRHASGHSLFANKAAMDEAQISRETGDPRGGEIVRGPNGRATGVFEERAMSLIMDAHQAYLETLPKEVREQEWLNWVELAQEECLQKGITSFQDAGSKYYEIDGYSELAKNGALDVRLWVMLRHSYKEMENRMDGLPMIDVGNHFFTCRAIKSEVDGALGAFGAWLLKPYNDKANFLGQNTTSLAEVKRIADLAKENGMQMCVHAIGDRANREVLNIYEERLAAAGEDNDLRWRIEHAQHLDTADIPRFRDWGIIASMQGIHCTSDAPFVVSRLGEERARLGAYPWRSLLDAGVVIANGTDAPVEDVDPIKSYYASVTRRRIDTGLAFFPEQSMTREEALYSYTLGNAFAGFEEGLKGSLEPGKLADLVVLSKDLLTCTDEEILETEVLMTMVGGEVKYEQ
jgi:predicted amidohydrolase YtcJ